jgi:UDP:flavonoid glycosyltransferase YjiC (YdhE family)
MTSRWTLRCLVPEMSHYLPVFHIGEGLVKIGHDVYFITTAFGRERNL